MTLQCGEYIYLSLEQFISVSLMQAHGLTDGQHCHGMESVGVSPAARQSATSQTREQNSRWKDSSVSLEQTAVENENFEFISYK